MKKVLKKVSMIDLTGSNVFDLAWAEREKFKRDFDKRKDKIGYVLMLIKGFIKSVRIVNLRKEV